MDCALNGSGDLAADERGLPYFVSGREELAQRLYIALSARKGGFLYDRELGSRLSETELTDGQQAAALAREALQPLPGAEVLDARLLDGQVTVRVSCDGEEFEIAVRRS